MPYKPLSELYGEIHSLQGRPNKNDVLYFTCPLCESGHGIMVSFQAPSLFPSGAVWTRSGDTLSNISISPSINCDVPYTDRDGVVHPSSCKFHGWVTDGKVIW